MKFILAWLHRATYNCVCPPRMPCFLWKKSDRQVNSFKSWDAIHSSSLKLRHHVIMLNNEFLHWEIHIREAQSWLPSAITFCLHASYDHFFNARCDQTVTDHVIFLPSLARVGPAHAPQSLLFQLSIEQSHSLFNMAKGTKPKIPDIPWQASLGIHHRMWEGCQLQGPLLCIIPGKSHVP